MSIKFKFGLNRAIIVSVNLHRDLSAFYCFRRHYISTRAERRKVIRIGEEVWTLRERALFIVCVMLCFAEVPLMHREKVNSINCKERHCECCILRYTVHSLGSSYKLNAAVWSDSFCPHFVCALCSHGSLLMRDVLDRWYRLFDGDVFLHAVAR